MPIIPAIYNAHPHKINSLLADIEQQFTLDEHVLISITSHFHKLFNLGLGDYGHHMAMMYALRPLWPNSPLTPSHLSIPPAPHLSPASRTVLKLGNASLITVATTPPF